MSHPAARKIEAGSIDDPLGSTATATLTTATLTNGVDHTEAADTQTDSSSLSSWLSRDRREAGDELLQRALVLSGLSDQVGPETERGKKIAAEADQLKQFAQELQEKKQTQEAMQQAHQLLQTLNKQYSGSAGKAQGLADESLKLWDSLSKSVETDQLLKQGKMLLDDWKSYAETQHGQQLLAQAKGKFKGQSQVVLKTLDGVMTTPESEGDDGNKTVLDKDQLMNLTETAAEVGKELHKELSKDEDVAELIAKAQKDLSIAANQVQQKAHAAALSDPNAPMPISDLTDEQKNTMTIMKGEAYIRDFRQGDMGKKLIAQGSAFLASGQLSPTALLNQGSTLMNDENSRQQFINKVKDSALEFLLAYLPTVKVPPVEGEKENVEYKLSNIDLSGFKVKSADVEVEINEYDGLSIVANNISCVMPELQFTYNKTSFPKLSGDGVAEAIASGVKFEMRLDLEIPERYKKAIMSPASSSSNSTSPSASPSPTATTTTTTAGGKRTLISSPLSKQIQANANNPAHTTKISTPKAAAAKETGDPGQPPQHGKPPLSVATAGPKQPSTNTQFSFPRSASGNNINPLSPHSAGSASSSPNGSPHSKSAASVARQQQAVARALMTDNPRLVLHSCRITLDTFTIKIVDGKLKAIYNFLLKLFNESIREYLEQQLNDAINEQSATLLATVNELALDYLPLLEKVMKKAAVIVTQKTGNKTLVETLNASKKKKKEVMDEADPLGGLKQNKTKGTGKRKEEQQGAETQQQK